MPKLKWNLDGQFGDVRLGDYHLWIGQNHGYRWYGVNLEPQECQHCGFEDDTDSFLLEHTTEIPIAQSDAVDAMNACEELARQYIKHQMGALLAD